MVIGPATSQKAFITSYVKCVLGHATERFDHVLCVSMCVYVFMSIAMVGCYPFYKSDPFIIKECPTVFFAGSQSKFDYTDIIGRATFPMVMHSCAQVCVCVCVCAMLPCAHPPPPPPIFHLFAFHHKGTLLSSPPLCVCVCRRVRRGVSRCPETPQMFQTSNVFGHFLVGCMIDLARMQNFKRS